jgi:hypothetical protein
MFQAEAVSRARLEGQIQNEGGLSAFSKPGGRKDRFVSLLAFFVNSQLLDLGVHCVQRRTKQLTREPGLVSILERSSGSKASKFGLIFQ